MEPTLFLASPERLSLPFPSGSAPEGREPIQGLEVTYSLDRLHRESDRIQTSLLAEIRYTCESGTIREWVRVPVEVSRCGQGWRCRMGPDWCWSTDWPS